MAVRAPPAKTGAHRPCASSAGALALQHPRPFLVVVYGSSAHY
jgi:hypothetical protein